MKIDINNKHDLERIKKAKIGDSFSLSGTLYSARDAAHKKIQEMIQDNQPLPISFEDKMIYYMGPTPAREGNPIGSCGPTSSYRMDRFLEMSLKLGVAATIGKGNRAEEVIDLVKKYQSPYLITIGGAAAYLANCIKKREIVLFPELKTEAVSRLEVEGFPVIVAIDSQGNSLLK
ncbi:MAG: fumarate hydratase C-terminal domain-containing protein [Spirochaetes bacterium]|nr:fumarate hydratase C-terminal domain-containing protein [Spirochaetota bacterium]